MPRPSRILRSTASLAIVAATSSCTAVLGIQPLRRDACGGLAYAEPACAECTWAGCCAQAAACAADPGCDAAERCLAACPPNGPLCRQACYVAHAAALDGARFGAVDDCRRGTCFDGCYGSGGWDEFAPVPSAACSECLQKCDVLGRTCAASAACDAAMGCIGAASDPSSMERCGETYPTGWDDVKVLLLGGCILGCSDACLLAHDFTCVDHYSWYGAQTGPVELPLVLVEQENPSQPVVGARVRACSGPECATCLGAVAVDDPTTDATGTVHITVPHGFEGCFAVTGSGRYPTLLVPGHPLVVTGYDPFVHRIPSEAHIQALAGGLGVTLVTDGAHGILGAIQHDCRVDIDLIAELATSHTDAFTSPVAYGFSIFSFDGEDLAGLVFNHPYGVTMVTGAQGGVEVSRYQAWVAPDALTLVDLYPRPLK